MRMLRDLRKAQEKLSQIVYKGVQIVYKVTEQQQNEKTPENIGREFLSISLALKEHFLAFTPS